MNAKQCFISVNITYACDSLITIKKCLLNQALAGLCVSGWRGKTWLLYNFWTWLSEQSFMKKGKESTCVELNEHKKANKCTI